MMGFYEPPQGRSALKMLVYEVLGSLAVSVLAWRFTDIKPPKSRPASQTSTYPRPLR